MNNIRIILNKLIKQRSSITHDSLLVGKYLISLPNIYFPLKFPHNIRAELDPRNYQNFSDSLKIIYYAMIQKDRPAFSEGNLICYPDSFTQEEKSSKWFFINGIVTSPQIACLNCKELARIFQRPINLIHTPTFGAIRDLLDSFIARTLRKDGRLSKPAFKVIKTALQNHNHVVLICHSQGTIISSYIVRKLQKDASTRNLLHKLEIYCFAGVADSFQLDQELSKTYARPVPYVEHFANEKDFFARIGILAHKNSTEGKIFKASKSGHLFNMHYLTHLLKGTYCKGHSRLYKYLQGHEPTEKDY